jgi:hypothetical protein
MAKKSYELRLGNETFKLRLTLEGQKNLMRKNPDTPIMAIIMSAVDDPEDMDNLLTEALNWPDSGNSIQSGAELYDLMVDAGHRGSKAFMNVVLNIAHNAGLLTEDEQNKVGRGIARQLDAVFESLAGDSDEPAEEVLEGDESPENPTPKTLDS